MFTLFKRDFKKKLRSPITWALIAVILFIAYITISSDINERKLKSYSEEYNNLYEIFGKEFYGESFEDYQRFTGEDDERTYDIRIEAYDRVVKYYDKDPKEFYKASCFEFLLNASWVVGSNNPNPLINELLKKQSREMWDEVSEGVDFDEVNLNSIHPALEVLLRQIL